MNNKTYNGNTFQNLLKLIKQHKMATKKKTTAVVKPKTYTLTEEQWSKLKDVTYKVGNVRSSLEDLRGEDDLSTIMFEIGKTTHTANECENTLDELLGLYDDCEYCDDEDDNF